MAEMPVHQRISQEVTEWLVIFYPFSGTWFGRLVPGRFKHVALAAYVPGTRVWVFRDVCFSSEKLFVMPDGDEALAIMEEWTRGATVLKFTARDAGAPLVFRGPLTCVSTTRHLLGLLCVGPLPDHLYRSLIKNGATVVGDHGEQHFGGRRGK
jgi:hypothetical protein